MMVLRAPTVRFLYGATALLVAGCFDANAPSGPTPGSPGFDGLRAFGLVEKQVAFGPRVPGAPGHEAQLDWMLARLDSLAPEVLSDTFGHVSSAGDSLVLVNVMARFRPELDRRIVILTHWDTRPTSDEAADPARRSDPVPGANDGGSGTAVLLELAALMAETPPPLGIDLLFVDGEDFGPNGEDMYLGAKRYARQIAVGEQVGALGRLVLGLAGHQRERLALATGDRHAPVVRALALVCLTCCLACHRLSVQVVPHEPQLAAGGGRLLLRAVISLAPSLLVPLLLRKSLDFFGGLRRFFVFVHRFILCRA